MFLLVPHQSRGLAGDGVWAHGSHPQPLCLGAIGPSNVYNQDVWEQSEEQDSQVLQRVQARERLLGHGADLVPLQEPGGGEKNEKNKKRISFRPRDVAPPSPRKLTASSASPEQRKARSCLRWPKRSRSSGGPFSDGNKEETTVLKKKKKERAPRPANNRSCDVNKTLCGFTFRLKRASL